ncbi:hypothetical protein Cadr_000021218 [Camelus dromedarius]|uniref:Uncharacterized protein n=1 Tax=Camelus dromedarius TaxID=9838 RepID=A0A5N4CVB5_CAMDR|nr:hypothetical protein Cadr_000021218 [Camelus dromedarius]
MPALHLALCAPSGDAWRVTRVRRGRSAPAHIFQPQGPCSVPTPHCLLQVRSAAWSRKLQTQVDEPSWLLREKKVAKIQVGPRLGIAWVTLHLVGARVHSYKSRPELSWELGDGDMAQGGQGHRAGLDLGMIRTHSPGVGWGAGVGRAATSIGGGIWSRSPGERRASWRRRLLRPHAGGQGVRWRGKGACPLVSLPREPRVYQPLRCWGKEGELAGVWAKNMTAPKCLNLGAPSTTAHCALPTRFTSLALQRGRPDLRTLALILYPLTPALVLTTHHKFSVASRGLTLSPELLSLGPRPCPGQGPPFPLLREEKVLKILAGGFPGRESSSTDLSPGQPSCFTDERLRPFSREPEPRTSQLLPSATNQTSHPPPLGRMEPMKRQEGVVLSHLPSRRVEWEFPPLMETWEQGKVSHCGTGHGGQMVSGVEERMGGKGWDKRPNLSAGRCSPSGLSFVLEGAGDRPGELLWSCFVCFRPSPSPCPFEACKAVNSAGTELLLLLPPTQSSQHVVKEVVLVPFYR